MPASLHPLFQPKSVALIGASEKPDSVGRKLFYNLITQPFGGTLYPVNPKRRSVLGIRTYASIGELPERIDLAIVATPAATVPDVLEACGQAGVRSAIVVARGFRESGQPEGLAREAALQQIVRRYNIRLLGPNSIGLVRPHVGLNASFIRPVAQPGHVAFLSQSGSLGDAILDWSAQRNIGFSAFVSPGSMLDLDWGDLITYFGDDPQTKAILLYIETLPNVSRFLSAAREVSYTKPIIAIKGGRTEGGSRVTATHTGAMTSQDAIFDAAFRRSGILRVETIAELFSMAAVLANQPRPRDRRLAIVSNAGGPAILATDALLAGGGKLATFSDTTRQALDRAQVYHPENPLNLFRDASPTHYAQAVDTVLNDPQVDGLLAILTPQESARPEAIAAALQRTLAHVKKPVLTCWMGGAYVEKANEQLSQAGIPTFNYPETAVRAFNYLWRYAYNLRGIYETPRPATQLLTTPAADPAPPRELELFHRARQVGDTLLNAARDTAQTVLPEVEAKQLLAAYGIPVVEAFRARTEDDAVQQAERLGFPVVLKVDSTQIVHKAEAGGVLLSVPDADSVRLAYRRIERTVSERVRPEAFEGVLVQKMYYYRGLEIILGSSVDDGFGPVLLFGNGGRVAEVYDDKALALPPLNTTLARRLMEQTRIFRALRDRFTPEVVEQLEQVGVLFSQLVVDHPRIREVDVNPLAVSSRGVMVLDAHIELHPWSVPDDALPRPVIRPYPTQYEQAVTLTDGTALLIRPIRPEDEPQMVKFHQTLSDQTIYLRFFFRFAYEQRVSHDRMARLCFADYDRELTLVAEYPAANRIVGAGQLFKTRQEDEAEFALLLSDDFQRRGLGSTLLRTLVAIGKREGFHTLRADIMTENTGMQQLARKVGFQVRFDADEGVMKATLQF
ncbi:acetyltransferase [Catalinimonas alkaloidigena]|uniref:Acetyltransferase n=1 Tax=Catalinimonas alkaloidigena TaxID=1075417 RepID=A0A1G9SIN6_9BACT|nr:bifunctional acetate--CoA ligase family protein/GNAT family N-acetyltransferase [Catalinimonas alkaloidigena]SDM35343.1 acetyltransferase [Catalinimonas alkaloidigena]